MWSGEPFQCAGGLNVESPPFALKPGVATILHNYEVLVGHGYHRVDGYERFDGRSHNYWGGATTKINDAGGFQYSYDTGSVAGALGQFWVSGTKYGYLTGTPSIDSGTLGAGTAAGWAPMERLDALGGFLADNSVVTRNNSALLDAPLIAGYTATSPYGTVTPTFTRASSAWFMDCYGIIREAVSGEARFVGARRVQNLCTKPQDWTDAFWTKTIGTVTATTLTSTAANQTVMHAFSAPYSTRRYTISLTIQRLVGTGNIELTLDGGATWTALTIDGTARRYMKTQNNVDRSLGMGLRIVTSGDSIYATDVQIEDIGPSPSSSVASDFINVGTTNCGADQVMYYSTENGNTYDAGTGRVTAASGGAIKDSAFRSVLTTDGTTGPFGLLIEPARTNLCHFSEGANGASWTATNITVTANTATDPAGNQKADRLAASAGNGTLLQSVASASGVHTFSIWMQRFSGTGDIQMTLDNGATWTTKTLSGSMERFFITQTLANPVVGIRIVTNGDAVEMWGAQLERGVSWPSSYIQTLGAASATKVADTFKLALSMTTPVWGAARMEVTKDGLATGQSWTVATGSALSNADTPEVAMIKLSSSTGGITAEDGYGGTATGPAGTPTGTKTLATLWDRTAMTCYSDGTAGTAGSYCGSSQHINRWLGYGTEIIVRNFKLYPEASLTATTSALFTTSGVVSNTDYEPAATNVTTLASATPGYGYGSTTGKVWRRNQRNYYRYQVLPVPGDEAVLGVQAYNDVVYAWRYRNSDTTVQMYKSTSSGWSRVDLGYYLRYSTGTAAINEGDTITGATSGATAVVRRVNIASGNYAGPTYASGRLAVDTIVGTFQNGENLQVAAVTKAVAVGTTVANAFSGSPSLLFESLIHNFYGATNHTRLYGVQKAGGAPFEYDPVTGVFIFIETGMTVNTATHIAAHSNHLFASFPGGSLQNSGTGTPLVWSPRTGASEIGIGSEIGGLTSMPGNTLLVASRLGFGVLHGTSNVDWVLKSASGQSLGVIDGSVDQVAGLPVYRDTVSVNMYVATNAFGDFAPVAISTQVRPLLVDVVGAPNNSSVYSKSKGIYRLFFYDGTGLSCSFVGGKPAGWGRFVFPHVITCGCSAESLASSPAEEKVFAGTDEDAIGYAYVMRLDCGSSFDGAAIASVLQLPYNYHRYLGNRKRWHKVTVELESPVPLDVRLVCDYDYRNSVGDSRANVTSSIASDGSWDFATWETFFANEQSRSRLEFNIDGTGVNMAPSLYHSDDVMDPFTVQGGLINFRPLGISR